MPKKNRNIPFTDEEFEDNFWSRVDMTSDASGCWLWTGCKTNHGHGCIRWKRKMKLTHVIAWLLTGHTIPEGLDLAHSGNCKGKPHCCNPTHLTPETRRQNMLDRHRDNTMPCKLTEEQVRDIRRMLAEGKKQKEIAKEFGVVQAQISRIHRGESWSHLV